MVTQITKELPNIPLIEKRGAFDFACDKIAELSQAISSVVYAPFRLAIFLSQAMQDLYSALKNRVAVPIKKPSSSEKNSAQKSTQDDMIEALDNLFKTYINLVKRAAQKGTLNPANQAKSKRILDREVCRIFKEYKMIHFVVNGINHPIFQEIIRQNLIQDSKGIDPIQDGAKLKTIFLAYGYTPDQIQQALSKASKRVFTN
jgi:hypothetical protein